jgi:hypothetical protein
VSKKSAADLSFCAIPVLPALRKVGDNYQFKIKLLQWVFCKLLFISSLFPIPKKTNAKDQITFSSGESESLLVLL